MGYVSYVHTVRLTNRGEQQNGQTHESIQNEDKIVLIVNFQAFFYFFYCLSRLSRLELNNWKRP